MASGAIKGITIEFRGDTTSLGKALNDVNKEIKTTDSALKEVNRALKLDPNNVELLAQKEALLNNQIAQTEEKLQLQKRAAEEAAVALKNGAITQEEYASLTAQLAQTEHKLNGLKNEASGTADALKNAGTDAKSAGNEVKDAGDKANDSSANWEKFGNAAKVACEAAAAAIAAVTAAVVGAGKALVDCTVDAAAFADEVLTASSITGMTTEEVQALQYSAELLDTSFETISGAMTRNIRSMSSAAEGTGDVAEAYAQLGIEVTDSAGNLRDSETVFWEAIDALGQISDQTERDALAMELFGKSAQELNPLIEAGSENIRELGQEAQDAGYIMDGDALEAFGAFDDQLQRLKVGTTAAKNALGTVLLPVLTDLAGEGVDLLGQFTNGILDANGDVEQMGEVIDEILPQILDLFTQYLPLIIELGGSIITSLVDAILENLPQILETAISIVESVAQGIIDNLPLLAPVIADLIVGLANFIVNNLPTIINAAIEIVLAVVNGITESLPQLIPAAVNAIITIAEALIDHLDEIIEAGIQLTIGLASGLVNAIPDLVARIPEIIAAILGAFGELSTELPSLAQTWGSDLIESFKSAIINAIPNLISGLQQVASTIDEYIGFSVPEKGVLHQWAYNNPGADMIDLFADGMSDEKRALQKALVQTGDIIYNGMTPDYSGQLGMIAGTLDNLGVNKSNGTYIINVMVGNTKLAQAVISAQQMEAYRAGGL